MKTFLVLTLTGLTAFGPLAYASARLECASGRVQASAKKHACCPQRACQCSIKTPSHDSSVPAQIAPQGLERLGQASTAPASFSLEPFRQPTPFQTPYLKAPPGSASALFSVLRI